MITWGLMTNSYVPRRTGKYLGKYWYKGHRWFGPTNAIGQGHLVLIEVLNVWGLAPVGEG